jgi:hypothetical protein
MMGGTAPLGVQMMLRATPVAVPAGAVGFVAANMGCARTSWLSFPWATELPPVAGFRVGTARSMRPAARARRRPGARPGPGTASPRDRSAG